MDFNDTKEEAEYRAKVRAWLDQNAERKKSSKDALPSLGLEEALERARKWQATKAGGGFACITWPKEVWTSGAHYCDYGIVVVRTDPNVPKHKGLTMFIIDMKSEGVEVRPIKQMSGESEFNEVFFTNVRVPDSNRLGNPGDGWKVALTTLMNERLAVGGGGGADWEELMSLGRESELEQMAAMSNGAVRERVADWYVQTQGPESSISKVVSAAKMQDLGSFAMDLQGQAGIIRDREVSPQGAIFQNQWMGGAGYRIAGGTDEILRNIVAERVLGLPQDIRVDKDKPYNELPK